jgi:hypothetical protein
MEVGLFFGSFLKKGEVFAYVERLLDLEYLKDLHAAFWHHLAMLLQPQQTLRGIP